MATSDPTAESFLQCLSSHSVPSPPISTVTYFSSNPSYDSILQSYIINLRFASSSTPTPLFIVTPSHVCLTFRQRSYAAKPWSRNEDSQRGP
ncbi:hypothetical protein SLA2020_037180 [Shorea laevis]